MTPEEALEVLRARLPFEPQNTWVAGREWTIAEEAKRYAKSGRYSVEYYERWLAQERKEAIQKYKQAHEAFRILSEAVRP